MLKPADVRYIDTDAGLQALTSRLVGVPRLAIDTEFHAEHRYRPELMLVQLAEPSGSVWIVDAQTCGLRLLAPVLEHVPLVVHGGAQDLALLYQATRTRPRRILDTQRAGGLLGVGYPTRLSLLVQRILGQPFEKAMGLTDWSARPLSARQLRYAAEDAAVLLPLADAIDQRLAAAGRTAWAEAVCEEGVDEALRETPEIDGWVTWDIAGSLDEHERRALHALMRWREERGRIQDQPPRQVLSDAFALDLARRRPASPAELAENRRMPQGLLRRHGPEILRVLHESANSTDPIPEVPAASVLLRAQAIELWASIVERDQGIARTLGMPRPLALRIAMEGPGFLGGWRAWAYQEGLERLLDGRTAILATVRVECRELS